MECLRIIFNLNWMLKKYLADLVCCCCQYPFDWLLSVFQWPAKSRNFEYILLLAKLSKIEWNFKAVLLFRKENATKP